MGTARPSGLACSMSVVGLCLLLSSCGDQLRPEEAQPEAPVLSLSRTATAAEFWALYASEDDFKTLVDARLEPGAFPLWTRGGHPRLADLFYLKNDGEVLAHSWARGSNPDTSVDFSPFKVTVVIRLPNVRPVPPSGETGTSLTIVALFEEATGTSKIRMLWDNAPTTLLDNTTGWDAVVKQPARFTGLAFDRQNSRLYIVDVQNFELLRMDDADGNGVPEALAPVPAAEHPMFCADTTHGSFPVGIQFMRGTTGEGLVLFSGSLPVRVDERSPGIDGYPFWRDSDGDGRMDVATTWTADGLNRIAGRTVYAGATSVYVQVRKGTQVAIHALVGTGLDTTLGEQLALYATTAYPDAVTLSRALLADEWIGLVLSADPTTYIYKLKVPSAPIVSIDSYTPDIISNASSSWTITLKGDHLLAGMTATLRTIAGTAPIVTVAIQDSSTATLTWSGPFPLGNLHSVVSVELHNPGSNSPVSFPIIIND